MTHDFMPPDTCPVCGEPVPRTAKACPGCGADERSGWDEEDTRYDGLDLPDSAYDDERTPAPVSPASKNKLWQVVTVLVLAAVITAFVLH